MSYKLYRVENSRLVKSLARGSLMFCVFNRPGSVLTDFSIETTTDNPNLASANKQLASSLRSLGFNVSDTAFSQSGRSLITTVYKIL